MAGMFGIMFYKDNLWPERFGISFVSLILDK